MYRLTIDFCGMTISWPERFGVVKIQRFSTKSWAEVPETQQDVATKWLWFWNNEHSQWVEYGKVMFRMCELLQGRCSLTDLTVLQNLMLSSVTMRKAIT